MQMKEVDDTSYASVTLVYAAFGDFKQLLSYDADGSILRAGGYVYIPARGS